MGRTYLFECSKCGYRATVSGGADRGRHVAVQTILCTDCKALHDAVTEFKSSRPVEKNPKTPPKFASLLNRLPPRGARRWVKLKPVCPISPRHRVRPWKHPDKCPKCGGFLDLDAMPFRLWD
jgi:hypothetical protein